MILDQDTWIALYGAKRILEGQLLYKDFFDFVTPGTDYVLAAVFYLFGVKLSVARIALAVSNGIVVAIVVFMSSYAIKNRLLSVLLPVLTAIYSSYNYYISHHWFILVPILLVMFSGIKNIKEQESKTNKWLFTGLATAGAFLFIQSIGLTLFGMIVLFIIWYYTLDKPRVKPILRPLMYYTSGFVLPLIFVVILFALSGSLSAFIYDSFIWPFSHYRVINLSTPSDILRLWIKEFSSNGFIMGIIYSFTAYFGILLSFVAFMYAAVKVRKPKTHELSLVAFVSFFCTGIIAGLLPNPPAFHLMVFLSVYMLAIIVIFEYAPLLFA
jgi:hypothetical protein